METIILGSTSEVKSLQEIVEVLSKDHATYTVVIVTPSYYKNYSSDKNTTIKRYMQSRNVIVISMGESEYNVGFILHKISNWDMTRVSKYTDFEKNESNKNASNYSYFSNSRGECTLNKDSRSKFISNITDVSRGIVFKNSSIKSRERIVTSEGCSLFFEAYPNFYTQNKKELVCHSILSTLSRKNNSYLFVTTANSLTNETILDIVNYIK